MKLLGSNRKTAALTLIEVLVVIAVIAILASMIDFGASPTAKKKALRIQCVNNIKELGVAYRVRGGDSEPDLHLNNSVKNGGVKELVQAGDALASYLGMTNEISSPKILVCPADKNRSVATNFPLSFTRNNVSYFVGVNASDCNPNMWLSGDDNLELNGIAAQSGLFELPSNAPVKWTSARHEFVGNIGLADGSVEMVNNSNLSKLAIQTSLATNRLAIP